jgi:hypothetical protein
VTEPFEIKIIHAFIASDSDGVEGICAYKDGDTWYPMIAVNSDMVKALRERAQSMSKETGLTMKHIRFWGRSDLEEITP